MWCVIVDSASNWWVFCAGKVFRFVDFVPFPSFARNMCGHVYPDCNLDCMLLWYDLPFCWYNFRDPEGFYLGFADNPLDKLADSVIFSAVSQEILIFKGRISESLEQVCLIHTHTCLQQLQSMNALAHEGQAICRRTNSEETVVLLAVSYRLISFWIHLQWIDITGDEKVWDQNVLCPSQMLSCIIRVCKRLHHLSASVWHSMSYYLRRRAIVWLKVCNLSLVVGRYAIVLVFLMSKR